MNLALENGAKIGIIGGGPAGSFTAIHLLTIAASLNKKISVVIFDKKDFTVGSGCNFCAGVLSNTLLKELLKYNIIIPPKIIQREIKGYYYETVEGTTYLPKPSTSSIYSVFRANGPCISKELYNVSFDSFLLQEAVARGAAKINTNITRIIFSSNPKERVVLYSGEQNTHFEFDLVFGAFGVNTFFTHELEKAGIGYGAPQRLHSGQAEVPFDPGIDEKLRENVIIFLIPFRDIYFFSFTPKEKYITVTAIGPHITKTILQELFAMPQVMKYFPEHWQFPPGYCHCHPQIPVTVAKNPFHHRFAVVGDACWSRYLKDGITSAFYTSGLGAESAFKNGISREAFREGYYRKILLMDKDNAMGKLLFKLHHNFQRSPSMRTSLFSMATNDSNKPIQESIRYILWGLFTGDYPYTKIMRKIVSIPFLLRLTLYSIYERCKCIVRKLF